MVQRSLCVLAVLLLLVSPAALACSCLPSEGRTLEEQVAQAKASADVVVLAYALNVVGHDPTLILECKMLDDGTVTDTCEEVPYFKRKVAHLVTERAWKGEPGQEFRIVSDGMCDAHFRAGMTYLIYMYKSDTPGEFSTSFCTRTRIAQEAESDIHVLDSLPRSSDVDDGSDK